MNFKLTSCKDEPRVVLKDALELSGCEMSINELPAGVSVPFIHAHKQNEELYYVISGKGALYIDGKELEIKAGDAFKIAPKGERCIKADANSSIKFICIQAKENSLEACTQDDGIIIEDKKPSWL
ncbi:cupin domain-containing protein [Campylobacter geochelonis]|uniref:cupin domain-containing protein n=1 Tax=Campylobacter geochelonis TaxID=1780362 RepID=UPI000770A8B7|nr:cupin domain-containing protein [Campylobacter geochelonis]CZE46335.1 mate efflux family protein [Campylobacter geochelonis]CZE50675.1 mate efflux family protein [Campylobacter geochelonis]